MRSKIGLNLVKKYSFNFSLPKRDKKFIKYIILHYTGMKKESEAINRLCNPKSKVSSHYFIKNNGNILNLVPESYTAWHAGISHWKNIKNLNKFSIGVEINNPGHKHGYKNFSKKQIVSITKILKILIKKYKIKLKDILGHSDIAPNRKKDPGEKFPWDFLAKKKLCYWHNLNEKKIIRYRNARLSEKDEIKFFKNLREFGYGKIKTNNFDKNKKFLTQNFQRRFRQSLINGKVDKECYLISKNLLNS